MRARSLTATLSIIAGLFVYALAVMLIAEWLPPDWPVQAAFFAAAGLAWIVPAARLVRWSARPPPKD